MSRNVILRTDYYGVLITPHGRLCQPNLVIPEGRKSEKLRAGLLLSADDLALVRHALIETFATIYDNDGRPLVLPITEQHGSLPPHFFARSIYPMAVRDPLKRDVITHAAHGQTARLIVLLQPYQSETGQGVAAYLRDVILSDPALITAENKPARKRRAKPAKPVLASTQGALDLRVPA